MLAVAHNGVFRHCNTLWYKAVVFFVLLEIRLQKAFKQKSISTASSFVHQTIHLNLISNPNLITCYFLLCNTSMMIDYMAFKLI